MARYHNAGIDIRRGQVSALLLERKTEQQIADRLGVSRATIIRDVAAVRAEWRERRFTQTDEWMAEELARLDAALTAIWPKVVAGDNWSIDRMLGIMERRAKYLGLDMQVDNLPMAPSVRVTILDGRNLGPVAAHSLAALRSGVEDLRAG